jgi:hypothetical protein
MTKEEVFRLKPGDLLRVESETETELRYARFYHAIVIAGTGPNVTLAWRLPIPNPMLGGHWFPVDDSAISSVLHRSRLTRIA